MLGPASAQDMPQPGFQQVTLTQDMVKRFVSSFPQLKALGKKYESEIPQSADSSSGPARTVSAYMTSAAARAEMQGMLAAHGFGDFADWSKVATSVALAYGYAKSGKSPDEMGAQADRAIDNIRNNPNMPDEQKQQVIAMMRKQMGLMAPPPGNVDLVKSMMDDIRPVMESD